MNTTFDLHVAERLARPFAGAGTLRRFIDAFADARDRRVARRELARMPAYLLRDVGIDPERVDRIVDGMIAARRAAR